MKDIYTGFSNYKEYNLEARKKSLNNEVDKWHEKKDEFEEYRMFWSKAAKTDFTPTKPLAVDIELSDACNLKCSFCAHGLGTIGHVGFMKDDLAKKLISQCSKLGVYSIKFNWRGEATINPFLPEAIKYAKEKGILEVAINTNGLPKEKDMLLKCIDSGIDRIIFSVDGFSSESYEKVRIGGNYEKLIKNINEVINYKKNKKLDKPFIRIQMVRNKHNENEVDRYIKYWKDKVDDIRISDVMDRGQGNTLSVANQKTIGRSRCPQPFQRMIVARDGKVSPCCGDWNQQLIMGDVNESSLLDIWKGKKLSSFRTVQTNAKLDMFEPCKSCYVKESYIWESKDDKSK